MSKFAKFREDLAKAAADEVIPTGRVSKVFVPGSYEVIIKDCLDKGPNRRDADWLNYEVIFEGAGGKQIRTWIDVPTADISSEQLDGRYEYSTYKKLTRFLSALGLDPTNMSEVLTTYFEDPTKLVGMHVKVEIGYTGSYADFVKNSAGSGFQLHNKDGSLITDEIFESRDAVKAHAQQQGIKGYKDFPEIRKFETSETKNNVTVVVKRASKLGTVSARN